MGKTCRLVLLSVLALGALSADVRAEGGGGVAARAIRIDPERPRYWNLGGKTVLLVGGFDDDNPFQIARVGPLLDEMVAAGGNYIRNTMSDRRSVGHEVYAYRQVGRGRYDLERWNPEYWRRFANFLAETERRNVVVQLELWDRFDFSRDEWKGHPFNPANNVNYTHEQTGLEATYPRHPGDDVQPFFHTVPGMKAYDPRLDVVRRHQERFVDKLLSYTLQHGNVLFCMNNETSTEPAWGQHWMRFVRERYAKAGVPVFATDMFNDGYNPTESAAYKAAIADPETYAFLDISQTNGRVFDEDHWNLVMWYVDATSMRPRPLNHTKIYGGGYTSYGSGGLEDGVERFWRNLLAGAAAARFHRPSSGNGLNEHARGSLRAVRLIESWLSFWDLQPAMNRLTERAPDEAYVGAAPGKGYLVYFTKGGRVGLDLRDEKAAFDLVWVNLHKGVQEGEPLRVDPGLVPLQTPTVGPWAAVVVRAKT